MNQPKQTKFILFSLVAGVCWGTSFPVVKMGLDYISPIWFSNLRLILSFFTLLLLVRRRKILFRFPIGFWILGIFNALGFVFQFLGMQYTAAGKAAFYINSNLVIVAVLSYLFYKEHFGWNKILGVFLAVVGIYLLSIGFRPIQVLFSGALRGDLLVLSGGVSWSVFMVLNKKMVHHPDYSVLESVTLFLFTSSVVMLPVSFITEPITFNFAWQGWALLLFSSFISLALPFYLWAAGLKGLTVTISSLLVLIEIVVALILSFVILAESLTLVELSGAFVLLFAIVLASLGKEPKVSTVSLEQVKRQTI